MDTIQETPEATAERLGNEVAAFERLHGGVEPRLSPLNGEWAGDISGADLFRLVMKRGPVSEEDFELEHELCDSFEAGYFGAYEDPE